MKIIDMLKKVKIIRTQGELDQSIDSIVYDSRKVAKNSLFVAIPGLKTDGHRYIKDVLSKGVSGVVVEPSYLDSLIQNVPQSIAVIVVEDTRMALSDFSAQLFDHPSKKMSVIGVTGTNGKTTTVHLIDSMIRTAGNKTGIMGTISNRVNGTIIPASLTTPESCEINALMKQMVDKKIRYCIMEVSSHALEMKRVSSIAFNTALFTNLTQDHLDFHSDMTSYKEAKIKLFTDCAPKNSVINRDDPVGMELLQRASGSVITYGTDKKADVSGIITLNGTKGLQVLAKTPSGDITVDSPFIGRHNGYNILSAIAVGIAEGFSKDDISRGISSLSIVPGRFESIDEGQPYSVLVDYAHTEDALKNVLKAARDITAQKVIAVFGCGGDRDKAKRPHMGKVAATFSDISIITSDNPRTENPESIIEQVESGVLECHQALKNDPNQKYYKISDRRAAIKYAISLAQQDDVVLIAGKGHEDYQVIGDKKIHFDDREVAREALQQRKNNV